MPAHACGGPRSFTLKSAHINKSRGTKRARLHFEFEDSSLTDRLFDDVSKTCWGPDFEPEATRGFNSPWPGDRTIGKLHRSFTFTANEPYRSQTDVPAFLSNGQEVMVNVTTTFTWTLHLRSKCYSANEHGRMKCQ